MCRNNSYNVECAEDGCTNRVTCSAENDLCKEHGYDSWRVDDDLTTEELDEQYATGTPVDVVPSEVTVVRDWINDPALSAEERMARFEALKPEPSTGPRSHPNFYVSPGTTTATLGTTTTLLWKEA